MAFAGEEIGLLGSSYYANHPTEPLASVDAMLNMDMIGRVSNGRLFVGGVGTSPRMTKSPPSTPPSCIWSSIMPAA